MASPAMLGPMTAMERTAGRYMRAPDGHDADDAAFNAAFAAAGEVEVGSAIETNEPDKGDEKPAKPSGKGPREKPVAKAPDADDKGDEKPAGKGKDDATGKGEGKPDGEEDPDQ
jgi:hypothetical protein